MDDRTQPAPPNAVGSTPPRPAPRWHDRNPLVQLTLARLREFLREPGALFWVFGFPILMVVALGLAFRNGPPPLPHVGLVEPLPAWVHDALPKEQFALEQLSA